jgi:peptidoglycan/xylan/chitin deacetylase (PgdA/CDA1 family)
MDDIQDYGFQRGQIAAMDVFLSRNLKLTPGLIMHDIGNDTMVIDKVREGYQKGLFELAIHGWQHVDYTKLSLADQKNTMQMANVKMKTLFGTTSDIFLPPYGPFDGNTIEAMHQVGLKILSSSIPDEYNFDKDQSNFIADGVSRNSSIEKNMIYHMSAMTIFKSLDSKNQKLVKVPLVNIIADVTQNIKEYGYAGIVIHPQDFLIMGADGNFMDKLDESQLKELSQVIDFILSKNIPIKSFHEVAELL